MPRGHRMPRGRRMPRAASSDAAGSPDPRLVGRRARRLPRLVGRRLGGGVDRRGLVGRGQHVLADDLGDALTRDDAGAHDAHHSPVDGEPGGVDDGRRRVARPFADGLVALAGRAPVEVDGDRIAEHRLGVGGRGRRRLPREVRARHRERPGLGEELERDGVRRHAERHGAARLAEVPLQRGLRVQDDREPAGPELLDEPAHRSGHLAREGVERGDAGDQHGWRRGALTALGLEESGDRGRVERVGGDAVDRVGGNHHEFAAADGPAGEAHAGEQLGVDRTVVDGSHDRSILDQRACRTRGTGGGCRATPCTRSPRGVRRRPRRRNDGCREPVRPAASVACSRVVSGGPPCGGRATPPTPRSRR